jgi:hypothetical protein
MIDADDKVTFSLKNPEKAAQTQGVLPIDDLPRIAAATVEKAREITRKAGTGWDFYAIHQEFTLSLMEGFKPRSVNGAFINFVKKKVAQRP